MIEKSELLESLQGVDLNDKDRMDHLIKNMLYKIKKGKIQVEIQMNKENKNQNHLNVFNDQRVIYDSLENSLSRNGGI